MAYDQSHYQPPQRPYNGRAAQPPGPPQGYNQPPPPQQYPHQQYDQYAQDGYEYDDHNGGYAQDYNGGYQQDMNGGGRGNGYPPQGQGYPQQQRQEYYGDGRGGGMQQPRGGGREAPPQQRQPPQQRPQMDDRMRHAPPQQRPGMAEVMRGGYDQRGGSQGRGYPNGGPVGRGGRPAPMERSADSNHGQQNSMRKPLKTPPLSPGHQSWDNPFPTFPGAKKKTSIQEEQKILQKMEGMNIGDAPPQNRPRTAGSKGSKGSQDRYGNGGRSAGFDDYGHSSGESQRRAPPLQEDYGRPSGDSQRNMPPRGYPLQGQSQGYPDQRGGPPGPGYGTAPPRKNGYGDPRYDDRENFGPPSRAMTLPNEQHMSIGSQPPMSRIMDGPGPSAPYNGPVGRGLPSRPSTASGTRPTPQKNYTAPASVPQQAIDPYENQGTNYGHRAVESISEFYDSYYDDPTPHHQQLRPMSSGSEMPNFDAIPAARAEYKRGTSMDGHIIPGAPLPQPTGYGQAKPIESQADYRAQAQPQAAVFEMANDAPPMPNQQSQQGPYDDYRHPNGQYNQPPMNQRQPMQQNYGGFEEPPPAQHSFQPPPRSTSAAPRTGPAPGFNGQRPGFNGMPNGPSPQNGGMQKPKPLSSDALPSHPPPVRAGLIPNSVAAQAANTKPMTARNYNNEPPVSNAPQPVGPAPGVPEPAQPVTIGELEQIKNQSRVNPNDQNLQMTLVRKLVEASEVIVATIPDQRMRAKTREKYVMEAHKLLKRLVALTNVEAMFYLADCYGRGALGLESDNKEAFVLYQSAAKVGHPAAAYRTAVCCELGNEDGGGTRKDPLKAIQWYKRAAMLGDTPAMYKMGMIMLKGLLGQPKNTREAVGWLKRAAERADSENPHALHELGLLYEGPQGDSSVIRDEAYSLSLFKQAADLGYKFSQFRLGCAYEYGLFNLPIDSRQSIMWYSRAAVQEEHQSELALSGWYLTGSEGVLQQSDTEAYLWARKAAMAGLAKAEYAMGYFTEVGIGSPSSLEEAKRWYWRAAAQNFPKARDRLEDLKRNGGKGGVKTRERISRSKVGKQNEGECAVM